jgi:hypothetical protein
MNYQMNPSEDLGSDARTLSDGDVVAPTKISVRSTSLRWLMLVFGCAFLMGSSYSYDIPGATSVYLGEAPLLWGPT